MPLSTATLDELASVDAELEALTVKLERSRQKKAAMHAQRERQMLAQQEQAMPTSTSPLRHQQLQPPPQQQRESLQRGLAYTPTCMEQQHPHEVTTIEAHVASPVVGAATVAPSLRAAATPSPVKGASELAKQKHQWDKPDWALPAEVIPHDCAIQTDSIQNPLLKQAQQGYERKVHAADIKLISGKFVKPSSTAFKPDPRLVWIVVNIDGIKVGKIVMHLYGNFLPIVDVFLELKGLEVKRKQASQLVVDDIDPVFFIHPGTPESFQGPKKTSCFGVVVEGHDIVQAVVQSDSHALITIKQSHIYPVKKAKS